MINSDQNLGVIFSDDFIKQLPEIDNFYNTSVVMLCKYNTTPSIKLRNQIELWFSLLPVEDKADILARIRSLNYKEHDSAFYELLFHQYFLEEGWKIEMHPLLSGLTPDFKVVTKKNLEFYVEVVGLFRGKDEEKRDKIFISVLRELNKIQSIFSISINLKAWFDDAVNIKFFANRVKKWFDELPTEINSHFEQEFNDSGIHATIRATVVRKEKDRTHIGAFGGPAGSIGLPVPKVKALINSKLNKYKLIKSLKTPFVLVMSADDLFFAETAIDWALYGLDVIYFPLDNQESDTKFHKDNSGLITPNPGLYGRSQNTGLSAVILVRKNWNSGEVIYEMKVYHNPWAVNRLPEDVFAKMPQFIQQNGPEGYITLKWINENKFIIFS